MTTIIRSPWFARGLGLLVALVVLGPALKPGSLFSLDLILPETVPVPRGAWGLGPELPRRVPLMIPVAWLSAVMSASSVVKAMIVAAIAGGFVGIYRIVEPASRIAAAGAGIFFAANPFLLTRIAAGHLMIVFAMAMLPWAYPVLLRPSQSVARTLLWCSALGFTGNYGGLLALLMVALGLAISTPRRWFAVGVAWFVAQLPWLVPGMVVFGQGATLAGAAAFATRVDGVTGWLSVAAGHGFWQDTYQIGAPSGGDTAVVAVLLVILALLGHRQLPALWRRGSAMLAGFAAVVVFGSAVPGLREVLEWSAGTTFGANLRESQRLYPFLAMWLAPAGALGAVRAAELVRGAGVSVGGAGALVYRLFPLVAGLLLATPGAWGLNGHLVPVQMPEDWERARQIVQSDPGTTVVVPWFGYTDVDLGGIHHVLVPWPIYLGGDVLVSSDLRTSDTPTPERVDPREAQMTQIVSELEGSATPPSARLASLGVRWVVFYRSGRFAHYGRVLDSDPGLERVQVSVRVLVYRVRDWAGQAVTTDGAPVLIDDLVEPLALASTTRDFVWHRPYASGWLRGLTPATETPDGLLHVPAGDGPIWYWPSLLVLAGDEVAIVAALVSWRRLRHGPGASAGRRRPGTVSASAGPGPTEPEVRVVGPAAAGDGEAVTGGSASSATGDASRTAGVAGGAPAPPVPQAI